MCVFVIEFCSLHKTQKLYYYIYMRPAKGEKAADIAPINSPIAIAHDHFGCKNRFRESSLTL